MLPSPSGRSWERGASAVFLVVGVLMTAAVAADPKASPSSPRPQSKPAVAPAGIPLPIGHEAKGLVLPDYNSKGVLQARFEAAVAKRIDADRVQFTGLKMTSYTPESATDLVIDMPTSTLDMNTRIITSDKRTTVTRADFSIEGDSLRFDTEARHGTLVGNVKMVISDQSRLMGKTGE